MKKNKSGNYVRAIIVGVGFLALAGSAFAGDQITINLNGAFLSADTTLSDAFNLRGVDVTLKDANGQTKYVCNAQFRWNQTEYRFDITGGECTTSSHELRIHVSNSITGYPLSNVSVNLNDGYKYGNTDEDGIVRFNNLASELAYRVNIQSNGYASESMDISIPSSQLAKRIAVSLSPVN